MAKKKQRPRVLRAQRKEKRLKEIRKNEKIRKDMMDKEKNKQKEQEKQPINKTTKEQKKKKSTAKAAGLKSAFVIGDEVLITSFGKGNDAVIEKKVKNKQVEDINENKKFDLQVSENEKQFVINNKIVKDAIRDNPIKTNEKGMDALHAKDTLEKIYFNEKTFNDNIHIQLIYNILDIKKIFAVYTTNMVFAVNNLRTNNDDEEIKKRYSPRKKNMDGDYLGNFHVNSKYNNFEDNFYDWFLDQTKGKLEYYKEAFFKADYKIHKKDGDYNEVEKERICNTLRIISFIRQCVFHDEADKIGEFNFDLILNSNTNIFDEDMDTILKSIYKNEVEKVNNNFLEYNNKLNFPVLLKVLNVTTEEEKEELVQSFYNFIIKKDNKNMGFSLKTMREKMLELNDANYIKDTSYDESRHKIYTLIDFVIFQYYTENYDKVEIMVDKLRSNDIKENKENLYKEEAPVLWKNIKDKVITITKKFEDNPKDKSTKKDKEKNNDNKEKLNPKWIEDIKIKNEASFFSMIVYFMTLFLDGKEINDFLSTLINKFENIQSFIGVMEEQLPNEIDFTENYKVFENSKQISEELRNIKSFARMKKPRTASTHAQYQDAADLLGLNEDEVKSKSSVKNFIYNNVINSNRFKYLIRYSNPKKSRDLVQNEELIKFQLKRLPDAQKIRYIKSIGESFQNETIDEETIKDEEINNKVVDRLYDRIKNFSYENLKDLNKQDKSNNKSKNLTEKEKAKQAIYKEQTKSLVTLYLTILYLITKALVNINSRYVIALYNLEKDSKLHKINGFDYKKKNCLTSLTQEFINKEYLNKHSSECLQTNINEFSKYIFSNYRNNIAHLDVVTNINKGANIKKIDSYFDLYHYIMQLLLKEIFDVNNTDNTKNKISKCFNNVDEYKSYSKDLLNILNAPFGYNLPRYKNLSTKQLFDKNEPKKTNKKDK